MALFTVVTNTAEGSSDGDTVTTSAVNTTGSTLIVIGIIDFLDVTASAISDSKSNTWTPLTTRGVDFIRSRLLYAVDPIVGAGHTFTATQAGSFPTILILAFGGDPTASPLDAESGTGASAVSSIQPGSVVSTGGDDVFVTCCGLKLTNTFSIDSDFTISNQVDQVGGAHFAGALAYKFQIGSTENPTWSWATNPTDTATSMGAFLHVASGASPLLSTANNNNYRRRRRSLDG